MDPHTSMVLPIADIISFPEMAACKSRSTPSHRPTALLD